MENIKYQDDEINEWTQPPGVIKLACNLHTFIQVLFSPLHGTGLKCGIRLIWVDDITQKIS